MKLNERIEKYYRLEEEIFDEIAELPRFSQVCGCATRERGVFKIIHEGQWDEVMSYCIKCGGYVDV